MLRPLFDNILLRLLDVPDRLGGVMLSERARDEVLKVREGLVVAVGPGAWFNGTIRPTIVEVGQKVLFLDGSWVDTGTGTGKEKVVMMAESRILAVVPD